MLGKGVTIESMKVRIGILETDKIIEIEIDDTKAFKKEIERAVRDGDLAWFTDFKGRSIGIPARNVAFIEIEDAAGEQQVGFAPAV